MYIDIHNTDKQYDIIYADPPWSYNDKLGGRSDMGATPYPQMSQDELNALPVCQLAKKIVFIYVGNNAETSRSVRHNQSVGF